MDKRIVDIEELNQLLFDHCELDSDDTHYSAGFCSATNMVDEYLEKCPPETESGPRGDD